MGDRGVIVTLSVPTDVPEATLSVVVPFDREIDDRTPVLPVIVNAVSNGEFVAPACVARTQI